MWFYYGFAAANPPLVQEISLAGEVIVCRGLYLTDKIIIMFKHVC